MPNAATLGPACATCRQKCRRCDRTKPVCQRCLTKGLECGGYPPKYKFCGVASRGKLKGLKQPVRNAKPAVQPEPCESFLPSPDEMMETPSDDMAYEQYAALYSGIIDPRVESRANFEGIEADFADEGDYRDELSRLDFTDLDALLAADRTEDLLIHYDKEICPLIAVVELGFLNPFREYFLPLAYENIGLLHAILGLACCHVDLVNGTRTYEAKALEHRLDAIHCLTVSLAKEKDGMLRAADQDAVLATINILVLHDICEAGISHHGAHLTGATYMCERLISNDKQNRSPRTAFLLSSLAWMDLMRGISGAEKLTFSQESREKIAEASGFEFELMCGCPKEIFIALGDVVAHGKDHMEGILTTVDFRAFLTKSERELRAWDPDQNIYPTKDPAWLKLASAFRHASILRILRFPDSFERPADSPEIQRSVTSILDVAAGIQSTSPMSKRLLLPLFLAGAESLSPHQRHYTLIRIQEIQDHMKFKITAPDLLEKVWEGRAAQDKDDRSNVPWMEYTCSKHLARQHDYLIW